jgi:hypothetical protein
MSCSQSCWKKIDIATMPCVIFFRFGAKDSAIDQKEMEHEECDYCRRAWSFAGGLLC